MEEKDKRGRPFLSRKTFEYMLHKWPSWSQSVNLARESPEIRDYPLPETYEGRQKWINDHGGQLRIFAINVMRDLKLPEHIWTYWLCCVLSNYETSDGSIDYSKIMDFHGRDRLKTYPPLPYRILINADASRPGKFGPIEIEIHPSFSYRAVYEKAAFHARKVAEFFNPQGLHPVYEYEQWAKGQSQRSQRKENARTRVFNGQCEIIDILREEAESSQVRDEFQRIIHKYKTYECKNHINYLRRKVYMRVRGWFSDLKPFPRI